MKIHLLASLFALAYATNPAIAASQTTSDAASAATTATMRPDQAARPVEATALAPESAKRLQAIGAEAFGIKWRRRTVAAEDRGFHVITDGVMTLSNRPAGNAYFVQNLKTGISPDSGFRGSDEQYAERGRSILDLLGVDKAEIAEAKILQQFTQRGVYDPAAGQPTLEPVVRDRRSLSITRSIRGLPVWSSRLMLDLDRRGAVAAAEISWPVIDPKVLEEAVAMQQVVGADFRAPEAAYAKIESVEAGILHSPAAAFVDDQTAAIRVIYRPTDDRIGKKAVSYLRLDGTSVAMPRQLEAIDEGAAPLRKGETPKQPR